MAELPLYPSGIQFNLQTGQVSVSRMDALYCVSCIPAGYRYFAAGGLDYRGAILMLDSRDSVWHTVPAAPRNPAEGGLPGDATPGQARRRNTGGCQMSDAYAHHTTSVTAALDACDALGAAAYALTIKIGELRRQFAPPDDTVPSRPPSPPRPTRKPRPGPRGQPRIAAWRRLWQPTPN